MFKIGAPTAYFSILCGRKIASFKNVRKICYVNDTHYKTTYCTHTHYK